MLRALLLVAFLAPLAAPVAGCHHDPKPMTPKDGELPPLPPASGSAVGYLVDAAQQLKLHGDQLEQLKAIDFSLSARNDSLDTQIRGIERPEEDGGYDPKKGEPPPRHNNAPGAQIRTTPDAAKLHEAKANNDRDAIAKALAILDDDQRTVARRILDERGITIPKTDKTPDAGKPPPGSEP